MTRQTTPARRQEVEPSSRPGSAGGDLGSASAGGGVPRTAGDDPLLIAGTAYASRLLVGTGKFASHEIMRASLVASGADIVTVALRRVDLSRVGEGDVLDFVPAGMTLLPNTSGALDAAEALRLARLGRAATGTGLVKLEVTPDPRTLAPDPIETLRAAELMVADGFTVLPYCSADPVLARRLEEAGCATVMPLGSWIGSNRGLRTRDAIEAIVETAGVPVVVDAGLGAPSDAAEAMEIGADAVLVNTAIAVSADPVTMARAFALATVAGRLGHLAGRGRAGGATEAAASSPLTGFLGALPGAGA
ncbi:thiazole-phosphate synthase [Frankia sp. EI5c]|uniref:thiazole synthase n=1 Tax=Frankia sp. EI5c TaxID=683316 RepID=UPI0007C3132E|nr:thiazole synthase [Frankia sp. EI5c]OAA28269.1 thiazole-phosphate synthase [Frankia sp. EI5c]